MAENTNIRLTLEAWASIVIQNWEEKILKLNIINTRQLLNSFEHTVVANAGGDIARIEFAFNYYGKFSDIGVGKGVKFNQVGTKGRRRAKQWYSKTFFSEVKKLQELLARKYARKGALIIINDINEAKIKSK